MLCHLKRTPTYPCASRNKACPKQSQYHFTNLAETHFICYSHLKIEITILRMACLAASSQLFSKNIFTRFGLWDHNFCERNGPLAYTAPFPFDTSHFYKVVSVWIIVLHSFSQFIHFLPVWVRKNWKKGQSQFISDEGYFGREKEVLDGKSQPWFNWI